MTSRVYALKLSAATLVYIYTADYNYELQRNYELRLKKILRGVPPLKLRGGALVYIWFGAVCFSETGCVYLGARKVMP